MSSELATVSEFYRLRGLAYREWKARGGDLPLFGVDAGSFRQEPIEQSCADAALRPRKQQARQGVKNLSQKKHAQRVLEKESINKIYRAMMKAGEIARRSAWADFSGGCAFPVISYHAGKPGLVRCRWCPVCERASSYYWFKRAEMEIIRAKKSCFFTGTFNKTVRQTLKIRATSKQEEMKLAYSVVTGYHKLIEAWMDCPIRYLYVVEEHKDGTPHIHALLHFQKNVPIRWLNSSWPFGYHNVKLAREETAKYVCKYVTKSRMSNTRLRASKKYGLPFREMEQSDDDKPIPLFTV